MHMGNEELMEIVDLWNLKPKIREKIHQLLAENLPESPPHLFRYYGPEPGKVVQLEREFALKSGARYALAVNSGTSALIAALVACGIGPGDEVIVPAYTFFATASAAVVARAIPVIAEVDETLTLDPEDVRRKLTSQTKAIMPVHMRGLPADMDALMEIARESGLKIIEDVAQACGGRYRGRWLGTFGDAGCFSFDFYKIVASGEGGMVVTDDEEVYIRAQSYHDTAACWRPDRHAREKMPGELFCGENYRMSEVHGAIALAQLRKLDGYLERCRKNKKLLTERLESLRGVQLQPVNDPDGDAAQCLILFAPTAERAREMIDNLHLEGVPAGGIYDKTVRDWHIYTYWEHILERKTPTPEGCPYTCPHYQGRLPEYHPEMCPRTLDLLSRTVHIAISPDWEEDRIEDVAGKIARALKGG